MDVVHAAVHELDKKQFTLFSKIDLRTQFNHRRFAQFTIAVHQRSSPSQFTIAVHHRSSPAQFTSAVHAR
jgi:hypothetical protein